MDPDEGANLQKKQLKLGLIQEVSSPCSAELFPTDMSFSYERLILGSFGKV